MSIENCQSVRPEPAASLLQFQGQKENVFLPPEEKRRIAPRAVPHPLPTDSITKARRQALQTLGIPRPYPHAFISPLEIDQVDLKKTSPQVVGTRLAKVVWYISDQKYQISNTRLQESLFLPKQNSAIMSLYYKCRNILMAQALASPQEGTQSKFMSIGDEVFFVKCILSDIYPKAPDQFDLPGPVAFSIKFQKIMQQNLSIEEIRVSKEKIKMLLEAAAKAGKASCFLDEGREYALICVKNPNASFSLSKAKVTISGESLPTKEDVVLNLLSEANTTGQAVQAFCSTQKACLAHGVKNTDGSFNLFEQEVDVCSPAAYDKAPSLMLQDILNRLMTLPNHTQSALAELLTEASRTGRAFTWYSYNNNLLRIKVEKRLDNSFLIQYISPTLTQEDLCVLGKDKAKLDEVIQTLYHEATQEPESPKITKTFSLPDQATLQLSLKNGLVTIGTNFPCGEGGCKKIQRSSRISLRNKIYAQSFAKYPKKVLALSNEMSVLQELSHPNLVRFLKVSKKSQSLKIEYCDSGTAERFIGSPPKNAAEIAERVILMYHAACGLAYIHSLPTKIAHMDFKPSNLLLTTEQGKLVGKVGDINPREESVPGIATLEYVDLEGLVYTLNTKCYAASQACDAWALGVTLFECLYGKNANPLRNLLYKLKFLLKNKKKIDISLVKGHFTQAHAKILSTLDDTRYDKKINDLIRKMCTLERASRVHLDPSFLQQFHDAIPTQV